MADLPLYIHLVFVSCVATVFGFLYYAVRQARGRYRAFLAFLGMGTWLLLTGWLSIRGFFKVTTSEPPRLLVFVAFVLLVILAIMAFKRTREAIQEMPMATLTYIHLVRIPIEVILWWLFLHGWMPKELTFEGANYDILSGITAVYAALFLVGRKVRPVGAIIWNLLTLGLLFNVVIRAIWTTPYFADPLLPIDINRAVLFFPYTWLPLAVVPAILFCHLAALNKLFSGNTT